MGIATTRRTVIATGLAAAALPRASRSPGTADPHRRAHRHDRPVCRQHRPRFGARRADGDRGLRQNPPRYQGRGRQRRPAAQARRRPRHRRRLVRQQGRGRGHRRAAVVRRLRHRRPGKAEGQAGDLHRRRVGRHHRRALRAEPPALGVRHLVDAARRGGRHGEGRRQHLVLHHRRLRLRPLAAKGRRRLRHCRGRQGAGRGAGIRSPAPRIFPRSSCRRRRVAQR